MARIQFLLIFLFILFSISACVKERPRENPTISLYLSLADYEEKEGHPSKADDYYQKAIAQCPPCGQARNNYGVFLCREGNYDRAIQQFLFAAHTSAYHHRQKAYNNALLCQQLRTKKPRSSLNPFTAQVNHPTSKAMKQ